MFIPDDDRPASPPVVVMSHHIWQSTYGGDPSVVGSSFAIEGHPFTVVGVAPPGFFGETLRGNPPDLWIPLQQEPLITGESTLLRQPVAAWLRAIGRLKPGATTDGMSARLTEVLRQWIQHDSGYPSNWMADIVAMLPRQVITVVPAGAGVGVMKEQYGQSLTHPPRRLRPRAADRVRERGQPAAGAGGRAPHTDRRARGHGRVARADHRPGAGRKRSAGDLGRNRRPSRRDSRGAAADFARVQRRAIPADRHDAVTAGPRLRIRARARDRASSSARRPRGSRRAPIRSRPCAVRDEAPATTRLLRGKCSSSCKPRCRWCWSRARRCWREV